MQIRKTQISLLISAVWPKSFLIACAIYYPGDSQHVASIFYTDKSEICNRPIIVFDVYLGTAFVDIECLGWMNDLRFYVLFNSTSVISGRWAGDNEMLCVMEPRLRFGRFGLEQDSNPEPLDQ